MLTILDTTCPTNTFFTLPHPATTRASTYCLTSTQTLLELSRCARPSSSLLLSTNTCKRDGSILLGTLIDPLLLILPIIPRTRFVPQDQILPMEYKNMKNVKINFSKICMEYQGNYKLDDSKVYDYLTAMVKRTANGMLGMELAKGQGAAVVAGFVLSSVQVDDANATRRKDEAERRAVQLVCEYLTEEWRMGLMERLGWTKDVVMSGQPFKARFMVVAQEEEEDRPKTWEEAHGYVIQTASTDYMRFGKKDQTVNAVGIDGRTAAVAQFSVAATTTQAPPSKKLKAGIQPLTIAQKRIADEGKKRGVQQISSFFTKKD